MTPKAAHCPQCGWAARGGLLIARHAVHRPACPQCDQAGLRCGCGKLWGHVGRCAGEGPGPIRKKPLTTMGPIFQAPA